MQHLKYFFSSLVLICYRAHIQKDSLVLSCGFQSLTIVYFFRLGTITTIIIPLPSVKNNFGSQPALWPVWIVSTLNFLHSDNLSNCVMFESIYRLYDVWVPCRQPIVVSSSWELYEVWYLDNSVLPTKPYILQGLLKSKILIYNHSEGTFHSFQSL